VEKPEATRASLVFESRESAVVKPEAEANKESASPEPASTPISRETEGKSNRCQYHQETQGHQELIQDRRRNFTTRENFVAFVQTQI
jgi:hypothetical protein